MKILVTGASGFIGRHLAGHLAKQGHEVVAMRRTRSHDGVYWNPGNREIDSAKLNAVAADAVINLAGESVAERWTAKKKKDIYNSRVPATQMLAQTLSAAEKIPAVFLCASAIGYYGERGAEVLTEDSSPGSTYLARVCQEWETATKPASDAGIRVAMLRFGIVLGTTGGALPRMLMPFKMGAGGRLGTGKQYMSWITLDDTVSAIEFALQQSALSGPVNIVSPSPVTNNEFTEVLGKTLHVPTLVPVPTSMAHLAFGQEMSDEVLLASDRVVPEKLSGLGFKFQHGSLPQAFQHVLKNGHG